jgi:hypothetical protein
MRALVVLFVAVMQTGCASPPPPKQPDWVALHKRCGTDAWCHGQIRQAQREWGGAALQGSTYINQNRVPVQPIKIEVQP